MNRKELIELAKIHFDWESLFQKTNFRISEISHEKGFTVWSKETANSRVVFIVTNEDEPAYLDPNIPSEITKWEKLDFIQTFLTGSSWELLQEYVYSRDGLLEGPLLEIAQDMRKKLFTEVSNESTEERLAKDPLFAKEYEKLLRVMSARQAVERTLDLANTEKVVDFSSLNPEEFKKETGLIDWKDLWADETPEHWFVPDLICEGRGHGCPAASGIGKSLLWLDVSAGLASGRSVLGYPAQKSIKVLYLDHENTPKGDVKPRLQAMGYKPEDLENLYYLSFPNINALNTKLGGKSFCQLLDHFNPQFVVIDTFSRFVEGDENSSKVAQDFYEYAGLELKRRKIAYLRIDHIGKNASKGARGSSAKIDDLDIIWTLSKTKEPSKFLLKNEKARVSVEAKEILIERRLNPLRHQILSSIDWSSLLAATLRHEQALSLIEGLISKDSKHSLAQGKVWKELKDICEIKKITRSELFEALNFVKGDYELPDEEVA